MLPLELLPTVLLFQNNIFSLVFDNVNKEQKTKNWAYVATSGLRCREEGIVVRTGEQRENTGYPTRAV